MTAVCNLYIINGRST